MRKSRVQKMSNAFDNFVLNSRGKGKWPALLLVLVIGAFIVYNYSKLKNFDFSSISRGSYTESNDLDSDGDGMSDQWEVAFRLDPTVNDANGDFDDDGVRNIDEYKMSLSYSYTEPTVISANVSTSPADYDNVINVENYRGGALSLRGSAWNNTLVVGIDLDAGGATRAIRIEDASNVVVANSNIYNAVTGVFVKNATNVSIIDNKMHDFTERGVLLSSSGGSRDVLIARNTIYNTRKDGIHIAQRSTLSPPVDHVGSIVYNNHLYDVALSSGGGSYHGIYIQSQDARVEGNRIERAKDGHAISVRSSGAIRNNSISGAGKSGIGYYADHKKGPSDLLLIEGNVVELTGIKFPEREGIELLSIPSEYSSTPDWIVGNYVIKNNTIENLTELLVARERAYQLVKIVGNSKFGDNSPTPTPSPTPKLSSSPTPTATPTQGICNPGDLKCDGKGLYECNSDGVAWNKVLTCKGRTVCDSNTFTCIPRKR